MAGGDCVGVSVQPLAQCLRQHACARKHGLVAMHGTHRICHVTGAVAKDGQGPRLAQTLGGAGRRIRWPRSRSGDAHAFDCQGLRPARDPAPAQAPDAATMSYGRAWPRIHWSRERGIRHGRLAQTAGRAVLTARDPVFGRRCHRGRTSPARHGRNRVFAIAALAALGIFKHVRSNTHLSGHKRAREVSVKDRLPGQTCGTHLEHLRAAPARTTSDGR